MKVDISDFELHNVVKTPRGLFARRALTQLKTPTSGTAYVGGFTVESPNTTEPWHYLFEQSSTTGLVTLRVYTEEYFQMFAHELGILQKDPVITWAVQNNQLMINSPAFSAPLYGLVGGGLITAVKIASGNPDTTALDIPAGLICSFGDRMPIAQGNLIFFNDPGVDPRTYVSENIVSLPGVIYDMFQGEDGALYVFTSAGAFSIPQDALGQGQTVQGFIRKIPGLETTRSRNACASGGASVVLQRDHVHVIGAGRLDIAPYRGRRYYSTPIEVDDLRLAGELYPTPDGFLLGFRGKRGFYLMANMREKSLCWVTPTSPNSFSLVGVLRTRDGEALHVLDDGVCAMAISGRSEMSSSVIATACGRIPIPADTRPLIRRVHVKTDPGSDVRASVNGDVSTSRSPTNTGDTVIGTSTWSASVKLAGRDMRNVRLTFNQRASDPHIEVNIIAGNRRIGSEIEVELGGQGVGRGDVDS